MSETTTPEPKPEDKTEEEKAQDEKVKAVPSVAADTTDYAKE